MSEDPLDLDDIDRYVLYFLQDDARNTTQTEIGDRIDVSATTIGNRIEDLEAEGIIETYHADIDYERAGFPHRILLFCSVEPASRDDVADDILGIQGVTSVRELISGEQNLHVEIVGRSQEEIVETITAIGDADVDVNRSEMIRDELRRPFDDFKPSLD